MSVWAGILLMFGAYIVTATVYPLDMADNSVDDMYKGCEKEMKDKVTKEFLEKEKTTNEKFGAAWNKAVEYHNSHSTTVSERFEKAELVAIIAYTNKSSGIYSALNEAVQKQGLEYKTSFKYHSLNYFLTRAIQRIAPKNTQNCHTAYRRTSVSFTQDVLSKEMRFGRFTSSSLHSLESKENEAYGKKSCFVIETCFGADITEYSYFKEEKEILIPPYEVFKVTKIETRATKKDLPCEVVYTVKSTKKPLSKYNCAMIIR